MPEGWLVEAEGLVHIYKTAELEVVALQGLDLQLAEGETIAIAGRSGSGKTTLMNILAGVEAPSAGRARVGGHDLTRMSDGERER
jgi:ABC-type lipoprotein export system ATPase subunit